MILLAVLLTLTPWKGPLPAAATADAVKYKLTVHGRPQQVVRLSASGLPGGWIAAFCTRDVCSPFHYTMQLDKRGAGFVEFQAVRTGDAAPKRVRVTVRSDDGGAVHATVRARYVLKGKMDCAPFPSRLCWAVRGRA